MVKGCEGEEVTHKGISYQWLMSVGQPLVS